MLNSFAKDGNCLGSSDDAALIAEIEALITSGKIKGKSGDILATLVALYLL